jgi:purine-binding chemotaxis protein CheW
MENQIVVFDLGEEHFGVDIGAVESIIKLQQITKMPHAPAFVEGVTNLRGAVLPVIDLRKRFGLPINEATKDNRIIVINISGVEVGMIVDAVSEVLTVMSEDVEPPSPIVTTLDSSFIKGIAKLANRLVIMVDLGKVLSINEQDHLLAAVPA